MCWGNSQMNGVFLSFEKYFLSCESACYPKILASNKYQRKLLTAHNN